MRVSRFYNHHKEMVAKLLVMRGMETRLIYELPRLGFVAWHEDRADQLVAAGFFRNVEGRCGMLDSYISDPLAPALYRHIGLDMITTELISYARRRGIKRVFAYSQDIGTLERAQRHGFVLLPDSLIGMRIRDEG